jgi:selenocysteine lyase/cysteine desulfurase
LKPGHEKFEDGTVNFLDIPAITNGINFIESIGMENINRYVQHIGTLFLQNILSLRHNNGRPLIRLYGPGTMENRGSTFLINFLDSNGLMYPFQYIEEKANAANISLRTGCFCNPGIDETNHCLSKEQLQSYFTSREHGDYFDMIEYLGTLRGAVRVSLGLATIQKDIHRFLEFAAKLLNKPYSKQQVSKELKKILLIQNRDRYNK